MIRIKRSNTDQIYRPCSGSILALLPFLIAISLSMLLLAGCRKEPNSNAATANENAGRSSSGPDAASIMERNRALDNSRDSTMKLRARIAGSGNSQEPNTPRQIQVTMYRKHEPDGRMLFLIEFTSPAEERDRDGFITVYPDSRIEGVRYVQSTDSFIVTTDPTGEDALFGMTLQELTEGQPEKYDFLLAGDETYNGTSAYRLQGKLKPGAESKFPRTAFLISKETFVVLQAEFYDNHNELARRLAVSKTAQIAGHWVRTVWSIDNRARQKKIDFEAVDVKFDQNLSDSIFTREHLKKIASR